MENAIIFNLLNFNFRLRWMQNFQDAAFWDNRKADNVQCKLAAFCLYSCVSVKFSLKKIPKWVSFILVSMDKYTVMDMSMIWWYSKYDTGIHKYGTPNEMYAAKNWRKKGEKK